MKRKVVTRRTGEKSRKCITSTLQELSLRKSFIFDEKHEASQEKAPPYPLLERYFSQKGYFLLATLRFMTAYVTPGQIGHILTFLGEILASWADLNERQQQYLQAIYETDQ